MSGKKQQGIALLFALAILSLLMVLALGFATSAIFEQKAAYNSANTSSARLLAQSALSRALVLTSELHGTVQSSHGSTHVDMLDHLTIKPLYTWIAGDEVAWEYITANDGLAKRLLGRFAYKIIPIAGIDPGAIVDIPVDESLNAELRRGNNITEINIMSVNAAAIATATEITVARAKKFNYATCTVPGAAGVYPAPANGWQSFQNLFTLTGITDEASQSNLLKWFVLDTDRFKAKESYWVDPATPKYYHRFNLARTDWDTAFDTKEEMYDKILLDQDSNGVPDKLPLAYSTTAATQDGYGIPWLAFFGYKADGTPDDTQKGTFNSVKDRRRQIAANLVDYCRTETALPTSDVDPASWGTTAPTFTGNKKTPYINEIGFHVHILALQTSTNSNKKKGKGKGKKNNTVKNLLDLSVDMDAVVELVDIYGVSLPTTDSKVYVDYAFSYNVTGTGAPSGTFTSSGTASFTITKADWSAGNRYASSDWLVLYEDDPMIDVLINQNTAVSISVNATLQIKKVILNYNGKNYDYSNINNSSTVTSTISIPANTTDSVDKDYYISCQANDPRQNLNPADWTVTNSNILTDQTIVVDDYNNHGGGSLNAENIITFPTSNIDLESSPNKVANSSTAYIRNGPMKSPWELGLIHRGKAWETINLKKFNTDKDAKYIAGPPVIIPGGGAYADGDANILDQVKMDNNIDNFKVNINSLFQDPATSKYTALEALFTNIKTGCTNIFTPETGTKLDGTTAIDNGLIPAITAKTKVTPYANRAQVVNDIAIASPIKDYTTDAKKEELIGKFVNLTEIGGKYYYVIVLAQAIKDIGGPSNGTADIVIRKKKGNTPITITTRLGQFDCDTTNNIYADEIIAEQKIKALVYEPPFGGAPVILSYEFVE